MQRFLHARPANHRRITVMALCQKKVGRPCCVYFGCRNKVESTENPFRNSRSAQRNFVICYWRIARRTDGLFQCLFRSATFNRHFTRRSTHVRTRESMLVKNCALRACAFPLGVDRSAVATICSVCCTSAEGRR